MNRSRAGGAVAACAVEGSTMTILARLGRHPVNFGAAARYDWGTGAGSGGSER